MKCILDNCGNYQTKLTPIVGYFFLKPLRKSKGKVVKLKSCENEWVGPIRMGVDWTDAHSLRLPVALPSPAQFPFGKTFGLKGL
jgi:hypothetical protein